MWLVFHELFIRLFPFNTVLYCSSLYYVIRGFIELAWEFACKVGAKSGSFHIEQHRNTKGCFFVGLDSFLPVRISLSSGLSHAQEVYGLLIWILKVASPQFDFDQNWPLVLPTVLFLDVLLVHILNQCQMQTAFLWVLSAFRFMSMTKETSSYFWSLLLCAWREIWRIWISCYKHSGGRWKRIVSSACQVRETKTKILVVCLLEIFDLR
jgi:hypothetical protein